MVVIKFKAAALGLMSLGFAKLFHELARFIPRLIPFSATLLIAMLIASIAAVAIGYWKQDELMNRGIDPIHVMLIGFISLACSFFGMITALF